MCSVQTCQQAVSKFSEHQVMKTGNSTLPINIRLEIQPGFEYTTLELGHSVSRNDAFLESNIQMLLYGE